MGTRKSRKEAWDEYAAGKQSEGPALPPSARPLRLEWRSPEELTENPRNWRTHPESQLSALSDVIGTVGWAGVCLLNEATNRLLDGHARRKVAIARGEKEVPVLVGSWTEEEEKLILATFDPISAEAARDQQKLDALVREIDTSSKPLRELLDKLATQPAPALPDAGGDSTVPTIQARWEILVECESERQQAHWLEKLAAAGLRVRSLIS